jgi:hypothetical protein
MRRVRTKHLRISIPQGLQVVVEPMPLHESIMGSLLHDTGMIHDQNAVGPADGGEAMSKYNARPIRRSGLNGLFLLSDDRPFFHSISRALPQSAH